MKNVTEAEIKKNLPPKLREMLDDPVIVITFAKAKDILFPVLEETLRSKVRESNLEEIAPVMMAGNLLMKTMELFANEGYDRMRKINNTKKTDKI